MSAPEIWVIIITSINSKSTGQDSLHAGMRRQDCAQRPGPGAQLRLEVAGDGNHPRGRGGAAEALDELELPFWIESDLKSDDAVGLPVVTLGLRR